MDAITRCCGKVVGKRQVEHLVRAAAVDVAAFYAARAPAPQRAEMLLVLSVDGKGIVMRPGHLRKVTRKAAERAKRTFRTCLATGEKTGRKWMATLAAVYEPCAARTTSSPRPAAAAPSEPRAPGRRPRPSG